MQRTTWAGAVGLNDFWPLGGPQADTDPATGLIRFRPPPNTFLFAQAPFSQRHVTAAVRQQLTAAGFDHLRVQYHPGPIMQALQQNDFGFLDFLLAEFDDCVYSLTSNGIGCNLSAIPTGYAGLYPIGGAPGQGILGGLNSPVYALYKQHLAVLAQRYVGVDPKLLMIELINEPPGNGTTTVRPAGDQSWGPLYTGDWQTDYLPDLHAWLRNLLPQHTLGMCSDGWENWQTLTRIDASPYKGDANLLWAFHPIFPVPAAEEGYIYNQYEYVTRLAYPPGAGGQTLQQELARMTAAVNSDPNVESKHGQSAADIITGLTYDLQAYFNTPQDYAYICACFEQVSAWALSQGIPACNVGAFEYGATRDNSGFPNNVLGYSSGYIGSTRLDRIHLYRDIAAACYKYGFRNCADHLDTLDYGITNGQNNAIGQFDPQIVAAIAPKRIPLGLL